MLVFHSAKVVPPAPTSTPAALVTAASFRVRCQAGGALRCFMMPHLSAGPDVRQHQIAQFADWVWGLGTKTSFYLSQVQFDCHLQCPPSWAANSMASPSSTGVSCSGFPRRSTSVWCRSHVRQRRLSGPLHAELGAQIIPAQAGFKRMVTATESGTQQNVAGSISHSSSHPGRSHTR